MTDLTSDQLDLIASTADAVTALAMLRDERDCLKTEVTRLQAELEPARYVWGPPGCAGEDSECDEYWTDDGEPTGIRWCSHVEHRVATWPDVYARERLEYLVEDIHRMAAGGTLPETAAELAEHIADQLEQIRHAVADEGGIEAYSTSQARAAQADLRAEREAWLNDPGRKELSAAYQREFEAREEIARLRRELARQTGADSHCHEVRAGDEIPCTARPGEPHVDAEGDAYATVPLNSREADA
jgi:hypothetical protein